MFAGFAVALLAVVALILWVIDDLSRSEHSRHSSGSDQFSPGDPAKQDPGPNTP
jgi:hypothetical protein